MASTEHLKILAEGLKSVIQWQSMNNNARLDLENADLRGFDLSGYPLQGANLSEAILDEVKLVRTNLWKANLDGASFRNAELTNAILREADLTDTDFSGATMVEADLRRASAHHGIANFNNASIMNADLRGADLRASSFENANLTFSNMWNADMRGAYMKNANLSRVYLGWASEWNADFKMFDEIGTSANFANVNFDGANLSYADLTAANLSYAQLQKTCLDHSNLMKAKLHGIDAIEASFLQANLVGTDLSESNFAQCDFTRAWLLKTNLYKARLYKPNLDGAVFGQTLLCDIDLTLNEKVDKTVHLGPSSIDYTTIKNLSLSPNGEAFLESCGVTRLETFLTDSRIYSQHTCLFIYAPEDEYIVDEMSNILKNNNILSWRLPICSNFGNSILFRQILSLFDIVFCVFSGHLTKVNNDLLYNIERTIKDYDRNNNYLLVPILTDDNIFFERLSKDFLISNMLDVSNLKNDNELLHNGIEEILKTINQKICYVGSKG
ncbi:pentapeptide repeat-containing protein [Neobacillus niacini]|uniref:pentapeptide repeat-containing protein n=1 Tax=Neobacillus niacini TaxID=86668 RepID=UPI003000A683